MKTPEQLLIDVERRLKNNWHSDLIGETQSFPHAFPLGSPTKTDLEENWAAFHQQVVIWQDWAPPRGLELTYITRRVHGTNQTLPSHLNVPDLDTAANTVSDVWIERLQRARTRLEQLLDRFPGVPDAARTARTVDRYTDTDFDLLLQVAGWFRENDATGKTPRQVPISGVQAKWLNTHQTLILTLSGKEALGLLPPHPARIHFTYLDPTYRATGGRIHDSATVGDAFKPPYDPAAVVVSENKDTAIHFPPIQGGIAVEGDGFGGKTAAAFPWLADASHVYYWGDIDTHGYEILNGWRSDGVPVTSILMDPATYETYEPYGTNTDRHGSPLMPGTPKPLPLLTPGERAVYNLLVDPAHPRHRRIEQERIPLQVALEAITATANSP